MKWLHSPYAAWSISNKTYPRNGSFTEKVQHIMAYAVLAPSTFNAQPWLYQLNGTTIEVWVDSQRLPVKSDKTGRFGYVSLGCFLQNAIIAATHFGWHVDFEIYSANSPENAKPACSLTLSAESPAPISDQLIEELFSAIPLRVTNRSPYTATAVADPLWDKARSSLENQVGLSVLGQSYQDSLSTISQAADMRIWSDIAFRQEHVAWIRSNITRRYDGMPGFGVGLGLIPSLIGRNVVLSSEFPTLQAKKNTSLLKATPDFAIFTALDDVEHWINIGRSYQKVALLFALQGVSMAPMGQFVEDDKARQQLGQILDLSDGYLPQFFCRVGFPTKPVRHSPRRNPAEVLTAN